MGRTLKIAAAVLAAVAIFAGMIVFYAITNLNSIIAERRQTVLDKVSNSLGREVHASDIKVSLGWGIMADVTGVQVSDDPAYSRKPFLETSDVYTRLELLPLLARRIEVTEVVLDKPVIRIVQSRDGSYNVSTIGKKRETGAEAKGEKGTSEGSPMAEAGKAPSTLGTLFVQNFTINGGTLLYQPKGASEAASVNDIDLKIRDFDFGSPFTIAVTFAALSDKQNFDLSAKIGPILKEGAIDIDAIPLSVRANVGPVLLSKLQAIPMLAKSIPPKLSIPEPVSLQASADGTVASIKFNVSSDMSADSIAFGDTFAKPANLPLKISADGSRTGSAIDVSNANLTLGDLEMKATNVKIGGETKSAHIDTNSFDLASLAKLLPALGKYSLDGKTEIHSDVALARGKATANGTVALTDIGLSQPDQKTPPLSHLNGNIKLAGTSADVGPLTFNLGASQATLKSHVDQFEPLVSSYELSAASVHLADLVPTRPPNEQIDQLFAKGAVSIQPVGPVLDADITSPSGNLANVPYQNLKLNASLEDKFARIVSLKLKAFKGELSATGSTRLEPSAPMTASVSFANIDLQQALAAQNSKAADTIRGAIGGNINVSAKTGTFDEMKPTFKGDGKLTLINGKLVGVNVGGQALKKVQNLPAVGNLVPDSVIKNHPELFNNPDTDIQIASLTFVLTGPRITSHDIKVQTVDYNLLGDGWFDMDKNIDLAARIVLSAQFSKELIEQKKQVAYIANQDGQIDIPLQITGQLPKPAVLPDVNELAQRAANHAVQAQGQKYIGKFLGKNKLPGGLGKFLGGDSNADGGTSPGAAASPGGGSKPPNPLDQLKKLF